MMDSRKPKHLTVSSTAASIHNTPFTLSPRVPSSANRALLDPSPPPSPDLPSLVPRHGKKPSHSRSRQLRRILAVVCAILFLAWLALQIITSSRVPTNNGYSADDGAEYEIVGANHLPEEPLPVIVRDNDGKERWTVSIPPTYEFPLLPKQYQDICSHSLELSSHLAGKAKKPLSNNRPYYQDDPYFMEPREAEKMGFLPKSWQKEKPMLAEAGVEGGFMEFENGRGGPVICERSMTFVMETKDAGMGNTLMGLWMAYGLAQVEKRAFFIEDSHWPYSNYTHYFLPPPTNRCHPPPPSHRVPCPHTARHTVVSSATFPYVFGPSFLSAYTDTKAVGVMDRQKPVYDLLHTGYTALHKLSDQEDLDYLKARKSELIDPVHEDSGMVIGLHVRRGDRHPWEWQYAEDYLPLERFTTAAREVLIDTYETQQITGQREPGFEDENEQFEAEMSSDIIMASDDPDMYARPELSRAKRAQDRISLASKTTLEAAVDPGSKHQYLDSISGWEGGFYKDVFWGLGADHSHSHAMDKGKEKGGNVRRHAEDDDEVSEEGLMLRELVGKSYLLDLDMLASSDAVVCSVSATGCRLLAVMMGWEKAFTTRGWKNVDGDFEWRSFAF